MPQSEAAGVRGRSGGGQLLTLPPPATRLPVLINPAREVVGWLVGWRTGKVGGVPPLRVEISRLGERGSGGKWKGAAAAAGGRRGSTAENTGPQQAGNSPRLLLKESRLLAFVSALTTSTATPPPFFFTSSHSLPLPRQLLLLSGSGELEPGGSVGVGSSIAPREGAPTPGGRLSARVRDGGAQRLSSRRRRWGGWRREGESADLSSAQSFTIDTARESGARVSVRVCRRRGFLAGSRTLSRNGGGATAKGERPAKVLFAQPPDRQPLTARLFRLGMKGGGRLQPLF